MPIDIPCAAVQNLPYLHTDKLCAMYKMFLVPGIKAFYGRNVGYFRHVACAM